MNKPLAFALGITTLGVAAYAADGSLRHILTHMSLMHIEGHIEGKQELPSLSLAGGGGNASPHASSHGTSTSSNNRMEGHSGSAFNGTKTLSNKSSYHRSSFGNIFDNTLTSRNFSTSETAQSQQLSPPFGSQSVDSPVELKQFALVTPQSHSPQDFSSKSGESFAPNLGPSKQAPKEPRDLEEKVRRLVEADHAQAEAKAAAEEMTHLWNAAVHAFKEKLQAVQKAARDAFFRTENEARTAIQVDSDTQVVAVHHLAKARRAEEASRIAAEVARRADEARRRAAAVAEQERLRLVAEATQKAEDERRAEEKQEDKARASIVTEAKAAAEEMTRLWNAAVHAFKEKLQAVQKAARDAFFRAENEARTAIQVDSDTQVVAVHHLAKARRAEEASRIAAEVARRADEARRRAAAVAEQERLRLVAEATQKAEGERRAEEKQEDKERARIVTEAKAAAEEMTRLWNTAVHAFKEKLQAVQKAAVDAFFRTENEARTAIQMDSDTQVERRAEEKQEDKERARIVTEAKAAAEEMTRLWNAAVHAFKENLQAVQKAAVEAILTAEANARAAIGADYDEADARHLANARRAAEAAEQERARVAARDAAEEAAHAAGTGGAGDSDVPLENIGAAHINAGQEAVPHLPDTHLANTSPTLHASPNEGGEPQSTTRLNVPSPTAEPKSNRLHASPNEGWEPQSTTLLNVPSPTAEPKSNRLRASPNEGGGLKVLLHGSVVYKRQLQLLLLLLAKPMLGGRSLLEMLGLMKLIMLQKIQVLMMMVTKQHTLLLKTLLLKIIPMVLQL